MADDAWIEESQRIAWSGLSSAWERWDEVITAQLAPVGAAMIDALEVPSTARHLDIASGTGEPGLTIARSFPSAEVVLTDLSAEMLAVARRRADSQGIVNVAIRECSADDLPFGDATFDTVSVRFGHMFFADLGRATAELVRVLRPGGRVCSAVWVEPTRNPWTSVAMDAIAAEVALPPPVPDGPSMYRCASPGRVSTLFEDAGLVAVREWDVELELVTATFDEYWRVITDHVSLAAAALRSVDETTRSRARERAFAALAPYVTDGAVRVPGLARCIVGVKPGRSAGDPLGRVRGGLLRGRQRARGRSATGPLHEHRHEHRGQGGDPGQGVVAEERRDEHPDDHPRHQDPGRSAGAHARRPSVADGRGEGGFRWQRHSSEGGRWPRTSSTCWPQPV